MTRSNDSKMSRTQSLLTPNDSITKWLGHSLPRPLEHRHTLCRLLIHQKRRYVIIVLSSGTLRHGLRVAHFTQQSKSTSPSVEQDDNNIWASTLLYGPLLAVPSCSVCLLHSHLRRAHKGCNTCCVSTDPFRITYHVDTLFSRMLDLSKRSPNTISHLTNPWCY